MVERERGGGLVGIHDFHGCAGDLAEDGKEGIGLWRRGMWTVVGGVSYGLVLSCCHWCRDRIMFECSSGYLQLATFLSSASHPSLSLNT